MKYTSSLPEKNDNVSHDKPVREFVLLFSGITAFLLCVFWLLGLLVDSAVDYISPEMEAAIFSSVDLAMPESDKESDPQQAELQRLVDELRTCADISYPVKVSLIDADEPNAFAIPGGRIVVFDDLLDTVSSLNGLSFVLAHELAHFKNRDHLRGMGRSIVLTAAAAMLTGAGSDFTQLFTPTFDFSFARHSQTRESLADQTALRVLNCQYDHVGGAAEFFEAIKAKDEKYNSGLRHYFSSHPEAVQRIDDLWQLAEQQHFVVKEVIPLPAVLTSSE